MNNVLEDLKKYFKNTPREKVMRDWAEAKRLAPKGGPKMKDFIQVLKYYHKPNENCFVIIDTNDNLANPEYTPGYFFNQPLYYESKCFFSTLRLCN